MTTEAEYKEALSVAADALEAASDWNVRDVQINPPKEWGLPAYEEDTEDGWCSTYMLAEFLREMSK